MIFFIPLAFDAPAQGVPVGILLSRLVWKKTRMVGLTDRGKSLTICLTVYTQYRRVSDRQTDGQTDILPRHSPRYAYASRGKKNKADRAKFI